MRPKEAWKGFFFAYSRYLYHVIDSNSSIRVEFIIMVLEAIKHYIFCFVPYSVKNIA